jgi:hypothetical protein
MSQPRRRKPARREEFRRRLQVPLPSVPQIEARLHEVLNPALWTSRPALAQTRRLRERLLTLPVMVAIVLSLVWRRLSSLTDVLRLLAQEGLLWSEALQVSQQALSKRLVTLPAALFEQVFREAITAIRSQRQPRPWPKALEPLRGQFPAIWIGDGSTLEALWKRSAALKKAQSSHPLAGKLFMMVEVATHLPVHWHYDPDPHTNEKTIARQWLEALPVGGVLVFDLGLFSFPLFDAFSEQGKYFVTRLREKTRFRYRQLLSQGHHYRDSIIELGVYRSNPCRHPLRLVEVLWGTKWYRYLTNVLDPAKLPARGVCELYRRRWRIEEAFLLTKRLLGLSYLWVGGQNGVQVQIYATWVFYAVLSDLCQEVAVALGEPVEKISVEMVFRSLYHYSVAYRKGEAREIVAFLAQHAKLFGLVKRERQRHKLRALENLRVWGCA